MKRKLLSEEQIIGILKEGDSATRPCDYMKRAVVAALSLRGPPVVFDIRSLAQWRRIARMVFYDASLLVSDHWSISKVSLFAALKSLDEYVLGHTTTATSSFGGMPCAVFRTSAYRS